MNSQYFIFLSIFFLLSYHDLPSQNIIVSEEFPFRSDESFDIVGKNDDLILVYRQRPQENEILAFDENLEIKWRKDIDFFGRAPRVISVLTDDDLFSIFYLTREKGIVKLLLNQYDAQTNLIDSMTFFDYGKKYYTPRPRMVISENKDILMFYSVEKEKDIIAFAFDLRRKKLLWETQFSLHDLVFSDDFEQALVDNKGNFYFILNKQNRKAKIEEHHFEVISFDAITGGISTLQISMDEHLTYDVQFALDELNQNLVAGGLYSVKNRGKSEGFFYLTIPFQTMNQFTSTFTPFSQDFLTNLLGIKKNKKEELADADIQQIVLRRDGGILLLGELNYRQERYTATSSRRYYGSDYIIDYYNNDIFVLSIHPDGSLHWETVLFKKQYSQDDGAAYSSYFLMKTAANLKFIFNDEIRNKNTVSEYILNGRGNFIRNSIMNTKGRKIKLRFRDAKQIDADQVIVPSDFRGRFRLVKINYDVP